MAQQRTRTITRAALPSGKTVWFKESSFFMQNEDAPESILPSPSEVRLMSNSRSTDYCDPVFFKSLKLVVKYGSDISIAEGQCLWAMGKMMYDVVAVPEVYGWCTDGGQVFIYMEMIEGITLEECWDDMEKEEKESVTNQLALMVNSWRAFKQDSNDIFLGQIGRQPLRDRVFSNGITGGPFKTVKEFHDFFVWLLYKHLPNRDASQPDVFRQGLPDNIPIVFTHGDLHKSNIIMSVERPVRVKAIVDWEQAGWFPEYWESCKAEYTWGFCKIEPERKVDQDGLWPELYLPQIVKPDEDVAYFWFHFVHSLGN